MNHYAIKQNSFAACDEIWGGAAAAFRSVDIKETVVCPKPRRLSLLHTTLNEPSYVRPLRWHASHHQEVFDSKAGNELLDIILLKGSHNSDQPAAPAAPVASSPPYFSGSPPSRVSNPLIQDARFGDQECHPPHHPVSPRAAAAAASPQSPSSARKGACVRANFGNNPAVRIEGFDCLDRDRRSCSISAMA